MRISDWSSDVCSSDLHHGYLAGEATVFVGTFGKLQKLCLRCPFDQATNPVDPGRIDMDMAGRTGADTAAIAVDARYVIEERRLACGFALGNFDFPPRSIAGYERHFYHHKLRTYASANQRACSRTGSLVIPRTRFEKSRSGPPVTSTLANRLSNYSQPLRLFSSSSLLPL